MGTDSNTGTMLPTALHTKQQGKCEQKKGGGSNNLRCDFFVVVAFKWKQVAVRPAVSSLNLKKSAVRVPRYHQTCETADVEENMFQQDIEKPV